MMKKVLEYQRRLGLIEDGDRIVAGFSGGADSVCLLLVLEELRKQWDFSYCAVHVEHGIRGEESLADAAFAEKFCKDRGIPFFVYHVDAPGQAQREGLSLEEAARKLRYECFEQARCAWNGNKIAVAHHADDNAETVLFHLARGTGLRGLGGIPSKRDGIIRPLLCVTRREVEEYLEDKEINYCNDSTNVDVKYARNRIRWNVIPQMEQLNARAVEHMSELSDQLREIYDYVASVAWEKGQPALKAAGLGQWSLDKEWILSMEPVLQKEFLYQVLVKAAGSQKDVSTIHVESLRQLFEMGTSKEIHLPYGLVGISGYETVCIRKNEEKGEPDQRLMVNLDLEQIGPDGLAIEVPGGGKFHLKILDFDGDCEKIPEKTYTKWFDYDKIRGNVFLRNRQSGDYLVVNQQGNQKKLKEYFINEKIPREQREQLVLLADDSHIIWVVGYRISEMYKVTPKTKRILEMHTEREK